MQDHREPILDHVWKTAQPPPPTTVVCVKHSPWERKKIMRKNPPDENTTSTVRYRRLIKAPQPVYAFPLISDYFSFAMLYVLLHFLQDQSQTRGDRYPQLWSVLCREKFVSCFHSPDETTVYGMVMRIREEEERRYRKHKRGKLEKSIRLKVERTWDVLQGPR